MGSSLLSLLKFAIGWPLSAIALFFVGKIIVSNAKTVAININEINLLLLFSGMFCFLLFYFIRTVIWKIILKEQGYEISQRKASFLWEVSELKRFVPGNIWSFLGRATLFSGIGIPTKTIAKGLIIETQSFLIACFIISTLSIFLYPKILSIDIPDIFFIPLVSFLLIVTILFINSSVIVQRLSNYSSSEVRQLTGESRSLHRNSSRQARTIKFLTKHIRGMLISKAIFLFPNFSPKVNSLILLLSILYLFLFGFGTFLTITSLIFISPQYFLELSMFFVFALLVGYLSVITPMGLGVRESVVIVGLSQFVALSTAGVASIFARIVLIISELLFLLFTFLWKRTKNKLVNSFENFVTVHKHEVILGVFVIIYIVYFTTTSFLRYDNFYTGRFDLGNMDQTVWNTIHGRIFELTDPNGTNTVSRLAFHADFILILLAPFYFLWEDPRMLLLIQTAVLAVGSIFVYKIAKNIIKNKNLSLVFAIAFLLNPAVQYTNLYDFHPVALATTFLLGAFYFLQNRRYLLFLLFAVLAAITKEQVWMIVSLFGLYGFIAIKDTPYLRSILTKRIFFLTLSFSSIFFFYYLIWHAIPNALGSEHFALSYYSNFGDSPTDIIKNVLVSPHKILEAITQKDQLHYLSQLFLPLGFTSLLSPFLLIFALPDLFINLLSNKPQLHQIYYQYSATITPFIFIASIFGIKNLITRFPKLSTFSTFFILLSTFYCTYLFGPLPFAKNPNIDMFTKPQKNKIEIENYLSKIPNHYSVTATNNVGSHLSQRQEIFTIPNGIDKGDFVIFLIGKNDKESLEKEIKTIESDKNYKQVFKINKSFKVFEKQTAP